MKKTVKIIAVTLLAACVAGGSLISCQKKKEMKGPTLGVLSYLRYTEDNLTTLMQNGTGLLNVLVDEGYIVLKEDAPKEMPTPQAVRFYDTIDSLVMGLKSGEVHVIEGLPQITARYLASRDESLETAFFFDIEKVFNNKEKMNFQKLATQWLSEGFSFMLTEKNAKLRDELNEVIEDIIKDGTRTRLLKEHIFDVIDGAEPKPIKLENKPGRKTIKVAVTGDLPPMDYIASNGTFAGFNTALLAEIGKRLDMNIVMVQVTNAGRAAALASGTVDVVFWTRGSSLNNRKPPKETVAQLKESVKTRFSEAEVKALEEFFAALNASTDEDVENEEHLVLEQKDLPDGTIITNPYFKDAVVAVVMKR